MKKKLDNSLPSLHSHYRNFFTTTKASAPVQAIDTFYLAVLAA
ncbi:hypothetical protein [Chitinophaga polysaccharea]|nr:hypothetical protein [Chitinophaga polysaccharea]